MSSETVQQETRSFDVIGSIVVLEIPKELLKKERAIAKKILETHKNIKTIVKKKGEHKGIFRLQKYTYLMGDKTKETVHTESGVKLKVNIEKMYFSPRLSTERLKVALMVKKGEKVLVMFSGSGPYPLVISKNSEAKLITAVEINPEAHKFCEENIKLNKISNITAIEGDVNKVVPKLKGKFDRIIMPLPKGAGKYLQVAFKKIRKGGVIHFYDFLPEEDIPAQAIANVELACKANKKKCEIIGVRKCGQLAPRQYRVCTDFRIL